jgi:dihydroorotase-like cyclic amidohydrolase
MSEFELAIRGGTIIPAEERRRADIEVRNGRVVEIGDVSTADSVVDAGGQLIMPGGIDTHVHLMDPGEPEREDSPTGTAAAAAAGVTTIVEHSHGRPVRTVEDLRAKIAYLNGRSLVAFGLAAYSHVPLTAFPRMTLRPSKCISKRPLRLVELL